MASAAGIRRAQGEPADLPDLGQLRGWVRPHEGYRLRSLDPGHGLADAGLHRAQVPGFTEIITT